MSASQIFLVVISGLGVIHGLFLAAFLLGYSKGNTIANRLLAGLLIVLSFRVGKSVFLEFTDNLDIKMIFIGLGSMMAIGPLFYLFTLATANKEFQLQKKHLAHFIPAVLGLSFGAWINESHETSLPKLIFFFIFLGYYSQYIIYLVISHKAIRRFRRNGLQNDPYRLLSLIWYGLTAIWFVYFLNLIDELVPYVVGPVLYSIIAYAISFVVIQKGYIQKLDQHKYKTTPVSDDQAKDIFDKVENQMKLDQAFRNPNITLKSLSAKFKLSTQVLSMVINQKADVNFNGYINQYRIDEAVRLLALPDYESQTIASIAYEVGFNSISSFNTAFKKHTGKTPQAYRKGLMK